MNILIPDNCKTRELEFTTTEYLGADCGRCDQRHECVVYGSLVAPLVPRIIEKEGVDFDNGLVFFLETHASNDEDAEAPVFIWGGLHSLVTAIENGELVLDEELEKAIPEPLADFRMMLEGYLSPLDEPRF